MEIVIGLLCTDVGNIVLAMLLSVTSIHVNILLRGSHFDVFRSAGLNRIHKIAS